MGRTARIERKTAETDITVELALDGSGKGDIRTGIGFFDHMLKLFTKHGLFDVEIDARGDLDVDAHHTVEDVGIVLGQAIKAALGDKKSIKRYGFCSMPMDESLTAVTLDLSGRAYLVFNGAFKGERVGEMDTGLVEEFFRAVAFNAGITLHINIMYGSNDHHMIEGAFKGCGRALDQAVSIDERIEGVMSTKGVL